MNILTGVRVAIAALLANKTRSLLASLGIVIGIGSVIVMVAIGKGSRKEVMDVISRMGENLITLNAGEAKRRGGKLRFADNVTTLTLRDALLLAEDIPELARVAPYEYKETKVKYGNAYTQATVSGSTPEFLQVRKYEIDRGRFFDQKELTLSSRVAVIGATTVKNIFGEDDPLDQTIRVDTIPFTIIGVFKSKGMDTDGADQDDILMTPLTTLMRRILNQNYIRTIYVQAVSKKDIGGAVEKIRDILRERHRIRDDHDDDFTMRSQLDIEEMKQETADLFTRLIVGVAAISLIVGGIGIFAVMLASVKERTREIGVRRAVGASKRTIILQFLLESLMISLFGGIAGIALGSGISLGLDRWGPWTLILEPDPMILATGVCGLIGVAFGVYPAVKASRLDPLEALRVE